MLYDLPNEGVRGLHGPPQNASASEGGLARVHLGTGQNICSVYCHLKPQLLPFQGVERQHNAGKSRPGQRRSGHDLEPGGRGFLSASTSEDGWRAPGRCVHSEPPHPHCSYALRAACPAPDLCEQDFLGSPSFTKQL